MQRGATPDYDEKSPFLIVNQSCLSSYELRWDKRKGCAPLTARKGRFKVGDLLVASTGLGVLGKCALADADGYCDTHVSIVRCKSALDAEYLYWWISGHYETVNSLFAMGATKQTELQKEAFLAHAIPMPEPAERRQICDFLRRECEMLARRDEALDQKAAALLELKSAVRDQFAFRGLSATRLRRSELEWHGDVPESWAFDRLGNLFREATDLGHPELPVLSVSIHTGISDRELSDAEMDRKVNRSEDRGIYKRVKPGDIVYNQMRAWQGGFGVARVEGLVSPAYVVARPRRPVAPRYVEHLLRTPRAVEEMRRRSRGIIDFRLRLYWDEFKDICIPVPPLAEQGAIADKVDRELDLVDRHVEVLGDMRTAIAEQRGSLIFDAVTGRIDVAGHAGAGSPKFARAA
jgi:type I restriction enzyme S subunit